MEENEIYKSPLQGRYASKEMLKIFSQRERITTWRKLWVALAKTERELGLEISQEQIDELEENIENIDFEVATKREKECRHDVMAHVYAYGKVAPKAEAIIHLGATSCYVTDNSDIIIIKKALKIIKKRILGVIQLLAKFADENKDVVTLGYTHYQPAQLTTVGKRATLWIQEFLDNLDELEIISNDLKLLGCKGTTGTQESFMKLFDGDEEKIKQIDLKIAKQFNFDKIYPISRTNISQAFR